MEWMLIFGYVCFALGAVLLIVGFVRLIWWGINQKNKKHSPKREAQNPNFHTYYKDPWLRAPSMASIVSRHKDIDVESFRVDTDEIYALPSDTDPRGMYLQSASPTEQELSQTESQIYADGINGSGSDRIHVEGVDGVQGSSNIYSVPNKESNNKGSTNQVIDEENDSLRGPDIPGRFYRDAGQWTNGGVRTESERSNMREVGYLDPPVDYSPERRIPNLSSRTVEYSYTGRTGRPTSDDTEVDDHGVSSAEERSRSSKVNGSRPQPLSSQDMFHTTAFRNSFGEDVGMDPGTPGAGSVKSMKSLYKYMYTEEPLSLDREMEYTFTSSVH